MGNCVTLVTLRASAAADARTCCGVAPIASASSTARYSASARFPEKVEWWDRVTEIEPCSSMANRGNRMSPTHANKKGVRCRYYVSQALLQNRKAEAGSIAHVPAPEVESLVCDGVRRELAATGRAEPANSLMDRELIERHVARVIVTPQALEVFLNPASAASAQVDDPPLDYPAACNSLTTITLPWTAPSLAAVKGIIHQPSEKPTMKPESRDALLAAIAKARKWIDDIRLGRF